MRRASLFLACSLALMGASLSLPADAAPKFAGSFTLDAPPAWQDSTERAQKGSWIKHSSPVVADLGPTGRVVLVASQGGRLYALKYSGGSLRKVWDSGSAIDTFIDSSPAVGDLNRDGCPEVVVGAGNEYRPHHSGVHVFDCHGRNHRYWKAPGHSKPNHVGVFSTPAIGDVDGDGYPEVVYGSFNQKIYVKDRHGKDLPGWPRENFDTVWSSPALADLNGDGKREIVIGTDLGGGARVFTCAKGIRGTLSIFNGKGEFMPNFPRCLDTPIWSSPSVQDLDGDRRLDVVVGTNNYLEDNKQVGKENVVRAWDTRSGDKLWETTLPAGTRVFTSPAIGDVGGDGTLDVAVGTIPATNYGEVFLLDAKTGKIRWHHEGGRREVCACKFMGSPVIADVDGDKKAEVVAASQDGGVNAWDEAGNAVIKDLHAPGPDPEKPWKNGSYMFFNSPAVADLDRDGDNELVLASAISGLNPLLGKVWIVATGGRGEGAWPFFKKTPDRRSALGAGTSVSAKPAPAPPPPPAPAPPPASAPAPARTTRPAASTPEATQEPTAEPTIEPTEEPFAFPTPFATEGGGPNWGLVGAAIASVLAAGGLATAAVLRRRSRSAG